MGQCVVFDRNLACAVLGSKLASKFKLYKPLVTSILLYRYDTWTLHAGSEKKDPGFRNQVHEEFLLISSLEQKTNDCVRSEINFLVDPQEPLLATAKRRKLAWFRPVGHHDSLSKTILQGTLEDGRRRRRQRKCWRDNIEEWTSLPMPETAHKGLLQKRLEE